MLERLEQDRLIERDPASAFTIKRLGALLLAKRLSDFTDVARKAARVVVYNGTSKVNTKLDQPGGKGYAAGFESLVQFVMGQLPQNEVIEGAIRRAQKLVPEIVIRELVANALIHQDFSVGGASVMVEVYDDRIEISNPGEPIVPLASALSRIDPGLLAKSDPPLCVGVGGVDALRVHWTTARKGLARAKQFEKALWSVTSHFSAPRWAFQAYAGTTREQNRHASGVDDTLLVYTFAAECSQCGSLLTSTSGSFFVSAKGPWRDSSTATSLAMSDSRI